MSNSKFNLGQVTTTQMIGLIVLAYAFSFAIRLIWVFQFQDNASFLWNNELMINTNDGYFFASGVQEALSGLHQPNPRVFGVWDYGVIFFTTLLVKLTPMSLETATLYAPSIFSSMVVIPMILIARLYKQTMWGFFAALLGSITWSYYNRTMTGYYDTDMFSAMAPMFILYFLMKSTVDLKLKTALFAGLMIIFYPFLYDQGQAIVYAIGIIYGLYMLLFHREDKITYQSLILVFISLFPISLDKPMAYLVHSILLVGIYLFLKPDSLDKKKLMIGAGVAFFAFLFFGDVFALIWGKIASYTIKGTEEGSLHFYAVNQTVREAGKIPFETFANRTSGSIFGVIIALLGYVVLVFRRPVFILALPLIGIGIFSLWGGLRFTVYAVPIAAMSAVYLFFYIYSKLKDDKDKVFLLIGSVITSFLTTFFSLVNQNIIPHKVNAIEAFSSVSAFLGSNLKNLFLLDFDKVSISSYNLIILIFLVILLIVMILLIKEKLFKLNRLIFVSLFTILLLIPNITHIIGYKVPTVLNKTEVQDLVQLNEIADSKDYTLTWWDYGYPVWFYSDTSTLIDGGKHNQDNFIISKIMQTPSPQLAANLSRLAVETYVDSNYSIVADKIFKDKDANLLLAELETSDYTLPSKTRDIYLYLPYRMLNIFPTVMVFGNLDLTTGKALRRPQFYPTRALSSKEGIIAFANGIIFDAKKGEITIGGKKRSVKNFIVTQNTKDDRIALQSQFYHGDGEYVVVYMKSYGRFVVMDAETFRSMYVQMFMLGKYDKNLFELIVSSSYSRIYKIKR